MIECAFNDAYCMLRYVQETLITFPLTLFALCSLCMRMIRLERLGYAGCIFMTHLLSRQSVSFPAKPLDLCNEVTSRRTCTVLLSSGTCKRLWLLFHWFCSLFVRCVCALFDLNVCDTLDGSSWHIYFLDSGWVSLQNPLVWCNEVTSRRTCTVLLSSALRTFFRVNFVRV